MLVVIAAGRILKTSDPKSIQRVDDPGVASVLVDELACTNINFVQCVIVAAGRNTGEIVIVGQPPNVFS